MERAQQIVPAPRDQSKLERIAWNAALRRSLRERTGRRLENTFCRAVRRREDQHEDCYGVGVKLVDRDGKLIHFPDGTAKECEDVHLPNPCNLREEFHAVQAATEACIRRLALRIDELPEEAKRRL